MPDLVLRSRRVVLPDGIRPATVRARDGAIIEVGDYAGDGIDLGEQVLMPGVVDTHVHVNAPGRAEWEGFECATRAAAAGGVTTLVDMPLNSIPATTSVTALDAKLEAARGGCMVDVGFWGGVVPGNADQLEPLWNAGVLGFKCFLVPSGVEEFPHVGEAELREALPVLAALGAPLLVHAELPGPIVAAAPGLSRADRRSYGAYLASRPDAAEVEAVAMMIDLSREFGTRIHIVHVASAGVLPLLRAARAEGLSVTAETCPHYLTFCAADPPDGDTRFKCAPPLRDSGNRAALLGALRDGTLDLVATDHSPCPPALKGLDSGDFMAAWGGIASLQIGLAATWTAARREGVGLAAIAEWMCAAPARLAGLDRKGAIEVGRDADLVVWDPEAEFRVDAAQLEHRHPVTPYEGRILSGVVRETYVRGNPAYQSGRFPQPPSGRLILRGTS